MHSIIREGALLWNAISTSYIDPVCQLFISLTSHSYDSSDSKFLGEFPEAERGIKELLLAISEKRKLRGDLTPRQSKNGSPEERERHKLGAS